MTDGVNSLIRDQEFEFNGDTSMFPDEYKPGAFEHFLEENQKSRYKIC